MTIWTAGAVDWRVELGVGVPGGAGSLWDTGEWDTTGVWAGSEPTWVVVSSKVEGLRTSAGRDRFDDRMRTATATVVLSNTDGAFNPDHGAVGPGDLELRPGRHIRVSANAGFGWRRVFRGVIDSIDEAYAPGGADTVSTLIAYGYDAELAVDNPPALGSPVGAGERTDERVARVLDAAGWPAGRRNHQTGLHTMIETTLARTYLEEIQRAAAAEGGAFFFDGDGVATFKARDWLQGDTRSVTPQLYPGRGDPGDPGILDVRTQWSLQVIENDIQYARVGGSTVHVQDPTSQALYRRRTSRITDFEVETDAQVENLADRQLAARAYDRQRIVGLELEALDADGAEALFTTELGDLTETTVTTLHGWGYVVELQVMGIDFAVTGDDWTATLRVDDDQAGSGYWVLGDDVRSILGDTTRLRGY